MREALENETGISWSSLYREAKQVLTNEEMWINFGWTS